MSKIDLHLIGNSIVDEIFEVQRSEPETKGFIPGSSNIYSSKRTSFGGLGNLLLVLKNTDLSIHVSTHLGKDESGRKIKDYFFKNKIDFTSYSVKETSSALILSEDFRGNVKEKTSFVKWGNVSEFRKFKPVKSRWAHISYLDILYNIDLSKLRKYYDYISADLCLNAPKKAVIKKVLKNLKYLDFLFISTNEVSTYTSLVKKEWGYQLHSDFLIQLLKDNKFNTTIILHSPYFVLVCDRKNKEIEVKFEKIRENVSVVGAGDKFAAYLIFTLLSSNKEVKITEEVIHQAYKKTARILEKNEEI